jgi:signal transduction histidine kinase
MNRDEKRLLWHVSLLVVALLALAGFLLHGWVARTLGVEERVNLAFLDLALRDRARYLGETLAQGWASRPVWPRDLADVLTRNHADYNRDIFMQVFTPDGRPVAASANAPSGTPLALRQPEDSPSWKTHDTRDADGRPVRLVTYPIYTGLGTDEGMKIHGYAQAGLRLPDTARALRRFNGILVVTLLAFGALFIIGLRAAVLAAMQRMEQEARTLQAAQHRFVGDAAHELGTPLAVLRGEMDLALRRERTNAEYRAALASCRVEIERLSRLAENLLALATADAGQTLIHRAPCDLADLARRVHQRFIHLAEERAIGFTLDCPASLPFHADAVALEQILGNLLTNAFRHTPAGERVGLTVRGGEGSVDLLVADTGEGIPAAHLPRLFERFHRVDKARSRTAGGAGLGLAIVKALAEAHGGTIVVSSELGKGSTFTCRLPTAADRLTCTSPA